MLILDGRLRTISQADSESKETISNTLSLKTVKIKKIPKRYTLSVCPSFFFLYKKIEL